MRRTHLRGHLKILKRLLIHICGLNLSLVMRKVCGAGTPKGLKEALGRIIDSIFGLLLLCAKTRELVWASVLFWHWPKTEARQSSPAMAA
jgi:hypothetical protein